MDRCLLVSLLLLANLEFSRGCFQGQWQCDDGLCIPDVLRCDGQGNCLDGSDEMNCPGSSDCPRGQFACLDTVGCVDTSARCDGQIQCPTGSDEENCPAIDGCLDSEWMCQNRICIPKELRCNGQDDCMDNSDEDNCDVCTESSVRCPGGTCLSAEKRCDGQFDCSDSSDEPLACGRICVLNNGGCSHVCTDEPWGTRCTCPAGFTLSPNGLVCEDLDECATPFPPCPHYCINTPGSYYCHCRDGFKLWEDTTCLASGNGTRLLMVQKSAMGLLNVKSQQFDIIQTSVFDPVALTFDIARGWYYWADRTGKIYKSDGQQSWTAYNGEPGIMGLAYDWLNGNLFWTNHETKSIYMQAPDGKSYTIVLSKNIGPSELVLVPVESSMFWINAGPGDRETIEKSWMDGSERSFLTIITAQSAHSLTADVAAMRLYWISDFKRSIETVKMDGSGRYSFTGLFNGGPALSLAVFESVFYWVDDRGLWQVAQNQLNRKKLLLKSDLPLLAVYHELQQPQGSSPCTKTNCLLCQLTKSNLDGYICTCPNSKVLLPDGSCEYPRFLYNTATNINLVEYRGREVIDTQLLTAKDGILSFDLDWQRDWVYWVNQTGHIQRTSLKPSNIEAIPAPLPVCFITVDQKSGSLFWVSCDQHSIGTAADKHPQRLYDTTRAIQDLHLDWMGRLIYWLEEDRILSMSMTGGKTNELLQLAGGFRESIAFDLRANSLLWNSKQAGLTKLSLLQKKSHKAGRRWNLSGSVAAALEPYLLTVSDNIINLWDQRDGSLIQDMIVKDHVYSVIALVGKLQTVLSYPACNEPSMLCRHSSVCLSQAQLCDGKTDCPEGDDEEFCVGTCPSKEDFRCRDRRSCISRNLVCDGRSHCRDGSDELDCSTIASLVTQASILKCRLGSKPCSDGRECVLYSHVCDGEEDCSDGSDELECDVPQVTTTTSKPKSSRINETSACISPSVKCPSAHICITPQQFCNGKKDCPDGFDENNCLKKCLSKSDFLCKDHRSCISRSQVCDGHSNCYDGSDEAACSNVAAPPQTTLKCRLGSRLCRDGTECVLYSHVCDGDRDCRDGSDELGCDSPESTNSIVENPPLNNLPAPIKPFTEPPTKPPCTSPSVLCLGSSVCLSPAQICDGKKDCPDGSDEKCLQRCLYRNDFLCKDRRKCVSRSQVCDGRSDCNDGSDEVNCPSVDLPAPQKSVLKCPLGSKLCQDGTECVLYSHICDGDRDCRDGSDEMRCDSPASNKLITEPPTKPPCTSPSVLCPGSSVCLSPAQICDGKKDCPDGSDEKCLQRCLYRTDFLCKDRQKCVSKSQVCDGRSDCIDGSDEVNCPSVDLPAPQKSVLKCPLGSKLCQDGTECVLYSHVCDGDRDCRDGSDELGCDSPESTNPIVENPPLNNLPAPIKPFTEPPTKPPCTSPSVLCPGSSVCLSPAQICDGKKDCPDGSDEKCLQKCLYRNDFLCKDRRKCVSRSQVCDGRSDCNDGSDEVNCPSVDLPAPQKSVLKCPLGSKLCQDGTECVLYSHICDGDRDCRDGSDEMRCDSPASNKLITEPPTKPPCTSPSVLCPGSSVCLSPAQICDGKDCPDGSDEKCLQWCPYRTDFLCKDRRSCVSKSKVCDGRSDCHDGSDEFNCPSVTLPVPRKTSLKCRLGSRLCQDGTECVLYSHVCDGDRDCQDGSDELGCDVAAGSTSVVVEKSRSSVSRESSKPFTEPPTKPPCTSPSVLCPGSSLCLTPAQICDGKKDCPDGSDEKCVQRCPYWNDFLCKDRRKCVSKRQVCDGRSDCIDGSDEVNCPSVDLPAPQKSVLKCRLGSKLCQDGTECVLFSHICDGDRDCRDGSDELGCDSPSNKTITELPTKPPCTSPSVLCPGSSVCLSPAQRCDGKEDCPDGADEKCLQRCPYRTDFLCKDRQSCVSKSQVCDGRSHCNDGSDEVGCSDVAPPSPPKTTLKCRLGSRLCKDGTECVLYSHVCDGDRDCRDGSDELRCDVEKSAASVEENSHLADSPSPNGPPIKPLCTSPSVLCPGSSVCLSPAQICDGKKDCPDGSDEKCVQRCPYWSDFRCKDRRSCVSKSQVCDGRSDCHDSSDEVNCPNVDLPAPPPKKATLKCRLGSRLCQDGTECVLYSHICDGDKDCRDGSDEMGCDVAESDTSVVGNPNLNNPPVAITEPPTKPPCTSPSVLCPGSSLCLSPAQICDGKKDCPDGSDEKCLQRCPYWTDFLCKDRQKCVSKRQVCDGRSDCIDGSDEVDCESVDLPAPQKSVLKCRLGSKLCQDGTECVLYSHICDGDRDCRDGSDELGCDSPSNKSFTEPPTKPPCTSPSVLCPGSSVCLNPAQRCDGKKDCPDGSDEKCLQRCPYWTDFLCKDHRSCVSKSQVCDGRSHCNDGSDEVGCSGVAPPTPPKTTLKCRLGSRLCHDGTECVLYSHVCDGDRDCRDGSDELGCDALEMTTSTKSPSTRPPCSSPSVLCPGSAVCIMPAQFCDGRKDCPDGSDEDCVKKCADLTDFLCKDRRSCVSRSLVCDGRSHCLDGSDELNCPRRATPRTQVLTCRIGSKLCDDGTECVLYSHLCDGEEDCVDGSDERGCTKTCEQGEFQCAHGKMCIPEAQVCDGKSQCRDNSDEMNCWKPTKSCEHRCADGKRCLPKKLLCDGERDCPDGSDEQGCDDVIAATGESSALAPASVCIAPSVLCPGSTRCILQQQLCDGQRDCPDGSDESGCVLKCENPNDFLCRDQRKCIQMKEVCDGQIHCPDGSDEKGCSPLKDTATSSNVPNTQSEPLKCRRGFKPCKDGLECVMYSHVCDGEKDCKDGSDEVGCATKCKEGEFLCSHGSRCIPQSSVCDGQYDCQDRSDEMDCSTRTEGCHHYCDNKTRCIPDTFLCDGEKDCADGSDEEKCGSVTCLKDQYRCVSGQCVSEALRCDGYADCSDRSDEADCSRPPRCPAQLRCPHSHECLQKEWLCDGEEDCKDGSDETNCNTPPAKCRSYQWQCRDSAQCIPVLWRCDSVADCHNGMDEHGCTRKNCPSHLYQCVSGECIDPKLVCNGLSNCVDGSDEGVGCGQRNCSSPSPPRCDHLCVSTPVGPTCFCTSGFRPQSNAQTCVDVDECNSELHPLCDHTCLNTRGSYTCHCHPGFYLEPDNKSCKTKDEPLLLASIQSELLSFGVHSGTLRIFSSVSQPVFSLDYHWAQQRVYWLSPDYQSIRFADMKNPNNKKTLLKGVKSDFLAVDWVGNNLYWVDGLVGQILAVKLSNTTLRSQDYTVVLGEDLEQPSSLVLLPHKGLMLWSEIGSKPQIEQSGMDGSRRKVVVSSDLSWPVSLAYDLLDNRMYWADEKLRCIGSASLDGENIKIMQLAETPNPFSVVVFNDRVFWSDTKRRAVRSAKKGTGKDQKVLLKRPGQPFGLKLMHALSQPAVFQPCDQLSCSHLCLLAPAVSSPSELSAPIGVCRCPKGLLLSKDKITCSVPTDSSFVLFLSRNTIFQIYLRSMRRDGVSLKKMPNNRPLALPNSNEALELDVAIRDLSLYVAYSGQGSVDVLRLSSSRSRQGLTRAEQILKLKDDVVTALAVDWVTLNLYWSSNERPDIHVTSRYQAHTTSLLQGSLKGTSSIALHPPTGRLCYTAIVKESGNSETEVICAWMDGRNKAVLWRKSSIPTSLVFSNQGNMIYWADAGESIIGSIGLDGTGYKQFTTGPGLLLSFTHTANIFLWVTLGKDVTRVWFTDGLQPKQLWFETKASMVKIRAFSNDTQTGENSCSKNNGDCEHLCLPYPGGRTCKCGRGFLSINITSCGPLPSCPVGERSCFSGDKCISSSKFCDQQIDCPDQSDEQDCPSSNRASLGSKASEDQMPQSNAKKNSILPVKKDSASCDLQHCSGHGRCITEGKVTHCQCLQGYKGESCQEVDHGHSHVPVIFGVFFLVVLVVTGIFVLSKRREWAALRQRSSDKENLMANMGLPSEDESSDSEELDSPVDTQPPSQPLVTVPEKTDQHSVINSLYLK